MNLEAVIDKNRVRRAFSRQAPSYEENAPMQKEVAVKLVSILSPLASRLSPAPRVLDLGIGTGFAAKEFTSRFPKAGIFGCDIAWGMLKEAVRTGAVLAEADAECLPYKDSAFDLAFSNLALQWTNLANSLREAFRILRPDGMFYFSTFGGKTLYELSDSYSSAWRAVGIEGTPKMMKFDSLQNIRTLIESIGFQEAGVKVEMINNRYKSPEDLLRSLKAIGAGNPSRDFHPSRKLLHETFRIYTERFGDKEGVPATFELIYASGIKR